MLTRPEIVNFLIEYLGIQKKTLATEFEDKAYNISKKITSERLLDIHRDYKIKVIDYFNREYNIDKSIFTSKFKNKIELEKFLSENPLKKEILTSLHGEWYMYAQMSEYDKPSINTIYYWTIEIFDNGTFSIDRTEILKEKEYGKVHIEKEAVQLVVLDRINKNSNFLTIAITYNDYNDILTGLMTTRNISSSEYHASAILMSKEKILNLDKVVKTFEEALPVTVLFKNLNTKIINPYPKKRKNIKNEFDNLNM